MIVVILECFCIDSRLPMEAIDVALVFWLPTNTCIASFVCKLSKKTYYHHHHYQLYRLSPAVSANAMATSIVAGKYGLLLPLIGLILFYVMNVLPKMVLIALLRR